MNVAVIGSGRQGTAAGYDLVKSEDINSLLLIDSSIQSLKKSKNHILRLVPGADVLTAKIDIKEELPSLVKKLEGIDLFISAVPYKYNLELTSIAIDTKTSMVDLGGHTGIVRKQLAYNKTASDLGITIVPDCGMGPGMNISMAMLAIEKTDVPRNISIWDGGLPKNPNPPWNYNLFFNIDGLTNEYDECAFFLDSSKVVEVPCFDRYEIIDFGQGIGKLEAAVTSGGLSTLPWTMEGKLDSLENKTLRYLGHWEWMKAYRELGLFSLDKIMYKNSEIVVRDFYHSLLESKIDDGNRDDICIMRVECKGIKDGRDAIVKVDAVEFYDDITGFMAMEKWTGWHASIVAQKILSGDVGPGAISVENSITGNAFYEEALKRGYDIKVDVKEL